MTHQRGKHAVLILLLLLCGMLLAGCATVPPQPITGLTPAQTPAASPAGEGADEGAAGDADDPAQSGEGDSSNAPTQARAAQGAKADVTPAQVELFYSGTASMMGFADAAQATIYETTIEALPAVSALCWPNAALDTLRYSADIPKASMRMAKDQLLARIGDPSFYLNTAMTRLPDRLKPEGAALITDGANMNEPILGLYDVLGEDAPAPASRTTGTQLAVTAADTADTTFSIIVTDLHELRMDDGALLTALNDHCLQIGKTIGVAAIRSEFAGLVPGVGANNTAFVWGAPPSGTLDYLLDYTEYRVGISIDPEQRQLADRPFYILCIGDQGAVNQYLEALETRLSREFTDNQTYALRTAVFGSGYVPAGYSIAGNTRYISGQGVTAIPEASAPGGVNLIELKASQAARFLEWEVDYTVHPADPRGTALTAEDFTFIADAVTDSGATTLPDLSWSIKGTAGDTVTLSLRLDLPQGILPQGNYTLELLGSLAAPPALPGADWMGEFGYDADGTQLFDMEQGDAAFDGSRTLFLSRLIDTLGKANLGRLGVTSLGVIQIVLTVYA